MKRHVFLVVVILAVLLTFAPVTTLAAQDTPYTAAQQEIVDDITKHIKDGNFMVALDRLNGAFPEWREDEKWAELFKAKAGDKIKNIERLIEAEITVDLEGSLSLAEEFGIVSGKYKASDTDCARVSKKGVVTGHKIGVAAITITIKKETFKIRIRVIDPNALDPADYPQEVLRLVNIEREKVGARALKLDDKITQAANIRAKEQAKSFSHTRPDGRSCFTALSDPEIGFNLSRYYTGENLYRNLIGGSSPEEAVAAWMASTTGHRETMLNKKFKRMGVGYYKSSNGNEFWVQLFMS